MILIGRKVFLDGFCLLKSNILILTRGRKTIDTGLGYYKLIRPLNEIVNNRWCHSSPEGKGSFRYKIFNSIERFADRIWSRWLYMRYEGSIGPQPESFSVKQKRKLHLINLWILFFFFLVCFIGQNYNPSNSNPVFIEMKIWPDNIEEYRDLLDAKKGKVSKSSSSSSSPATTTTTTVTNSP